MAVDGISSSSSLYFAATQMAGQAAASKTQKNKKSEKIKTSFSNALEKSQAENALIQEGFPPEILGMETEEAAIYLRDEVDIAGDKLADFQTPENFADYRRKLSQFFKFLEKNNFQVKKKERRGFNIKGKPLPPRVQIRVINEKLDEMARYLLSSHKDKLFMLSKVDEIKGLLVNLLG